MAKIITGSVLTRIYSLILVIVLSLSLFSCDSSKTEIEEKPQEKHSYVSDLRTQVKKSPTEYNGKRVNLKGWVVEDDGAFYLLDYSSPGGTMFRYEFRTGKIANIKMMISDEMVCNVLETGDYIEVSGTVQISDEGISLGDCEVSILTAVGEKS